MVFAIQELRCISGNDLNLEGLVGRITTFELSNFDNYKQENIESTFKAKLSLKDSKEIRKKKKKSKIKYASNDNNTDEEDIEQLEALLARRFHRGKGNFKGKLPIICFNCNEVGHIFVRCTQKKNYKEERKYKNRKEDDGKDLRKKGKKSYYIADEQDSDENDDEVVYVAMKDESDDDEEIALMTCVIKDILTMMCASAHIYTYSIVIVTNDLLIQVTNNAEQSTI